MISIFIIGWLLLFLMLSVKAGKNDYIQSPMSRTQFNVDYCFIHKIVYLAGIGGEKCDQCDRGFVQNAVNDVNHPVLNRTIPNGQGPDCVACGECFSNWDRILEELREKTENTVGKARRVKVSTKMTIL